LLAVIAVGLATLLTIDLVRGRSVGELAMTAVDLQEGGIASLIRMLTMSSEAFAAHFSMYGVLAFDVPIRPGQSVFSLVGSIVPSAIWPDRPADVYAYYANAVGAAQGQGFTIHHATACYLNFGVPGVLLGGAIMGLVWGRLTAGSVTRLSSNERALGHLWRFLSPTLFVAFLPALLRAGPEAYKALVVEGLLLPILLVFASVRSDTSAAGSESVGIVRRASSVRTAYK
jgi:hypothetical protein